MREGVISKYAAVQELRGDGTVVVLCTRVYYNVIKRTHIEQNVNTDWLTDIEQTSACSDYPPMYRPIPVYLDHDVHLNINVFPISLQST